MSYRKITVRGREFQYSVGRMYTKIRGIGVFKNEDLFETVPVAQYLHYDFDPDEITIWSKIPRITPSIIFRKILGSGVLK